MSVEILIYTYLSICAGMIVFNIEIGRAHV